MEIEEIIKDLNELNFTAIDFETANEQRNSVCSVGIINVKNGFIKNKINFLVRPIELRFSEINKNIHGISETDVLNAPEFNIIWEKIYPLINRQILLAHNADFEIEVLRQTLDYYSLTEQKNKFICTQRLAQEAFPDLLNYRLNDVATYLDLQLLHHDSLSDATITAEIGIKAIPIYDKSFYDYRNQELTNNIPKKKSVEKKNTYLSGFELKKIDSSLLKPNLENANPNNIFYDKKVVFTGNMQKISRQEAAAKIQILGADINTSISKKTEIIIIGDGAGPSKMKKIEDLKSQGFDIKLIYEDEFLSLIK